jgi:hypothetical protein
VLVSMAYICVIFLVFFWISINMFVQVNHESVLSL